MPTIITTEQLAQAQRTDEELKNLLQNETRLLQLKKLSIDNSVTIIYCDASTKELRPYIPKSLRRRIFNVPHGLAHLSGHVTHKMIEQRFVWPEMNRNITECVRTCLQCQRNKIHRHNRLRPEQFPVPNTRFDHMHIDIGTITCYTRIPLLRNDDWSVYEIARGSASVRRFGRKGSRSSCQHLGFSFRCSQNHYYRSRYTIRIPTI